MNNSYLVSFADLEEPSCWIKRFEGHSLEEVQDKIRQYIDSNWDLEDNLPENYNEMKATLADDYGIVIGNIEDLEIL